MFNLLKYFKKKPITVQDNDRVFNDQENRDVTFDKSKVETLAGLKIIKTARGEEEIQKAIDAGFNVLKYKVEASDNIRITDVYILDKKTGEIEISAYSNDTMMYGTSRGKKIIKEKTYYPYVFPDTAAYVLPDALKIDERVIIQDLIEDIVGGSHAWGTYRQDSAEAVWNGEKFIIDINSFRPEVTMG